MKEYLIAVVLLFSSIYELNAQNAVVSSGDDIVGIGGSLSYSLGQIVYTTNLGTNATAAQGVQQPIEISTELGIPEANGINLISVFPNPTVSFVVLKIEEYEIANLTFNLFDSNGRLITNEKITNNETQISIENEPAAIYFLKVLDRNREIKTFKILKK